LSSTTGALSADPATVHPRERRIQFSPQPVSVLNTEKLGCCESLERLAKFGSVLPLCESMSDEGALLSKAPDASIEIGLRASELGLEFSQVCHFGRRRSQL
jgi:hypothetical protein